MNKYILSIAVSSLVIGLASWKIKKQFELIDLEVRSHTSVMGLVEQQLDEEES